MAKRSFWLKRIEDAWQKHSIIWLSGVRRAGKTYIDRCVDALSQSILVKVFRCVQKEKRPRWGITSP